jgi:hypothetical protein
LPSIFRDIDAPDTKTVREHLRGFKEDMPDGDALKQFLEQSKSNSTREFTKALSQYHRMIHPKADNQDVNEEVVQNFIEDVYWAVGQHHGLRTPLLDWTNDPYKALFFAFCEREGDDGRRVVFGLAEKSRLLMEDDLPKKRYIQFLGNLAFAQTVLTSPGSPSEFQSKVLPMLKRIEAQEGLFTRTLRKEDVEKHAKQFYRHYKRHRRKEIVFLVKLLVPDAARGEILQKLEKKGITYKAMYPDLQGAALHCNLRLEQADSGVRA